MQCVRSSWFFVCIHLDPLTTPISHLVLSTTVFLPSSTNHPFPRSHTFCSARCYALSRCALPCYALPCYALPRYALTCYALPCYVRLGSLARLTHHKSRSDSSQSSSWHQSIRPGQHPIARATVPPTTTHPFSSSNPFFNAVSSLSLSFICALVAIHPTVNI